MIKYVAFVAAMLVSSTAFASNTFCNINGHCHVQPVVERVVVNRVVNVPVRERVVTEFVEVPTLRVERVVDNHHGNLAVVRVVEKQRVQAVKQVKVVAQPVVVEKVVVKQQQQRRRGIRGRR